LIAAQIRQKSQPNCSFFAAHFHFLFVDSSKSTAPFPLTATPFRDRGGVDLSPWTGGNINLQRRFNGKRSQIFYLSGAFTHPKFPFLGVKAGFFYDDWERIPLSFLPRRDRIGSSKTWLIRPLECRIRWRFAAENVIIPALEMLGPSRF